jgi:hypothetical protein
MHAIPRFQVLDQFDFFKDLNEWVLCVELDTCIR